jgi:large subunit ribosomal protein L18
MKRVIDKQRKLQQRKRHIRKRINGTGTKPRMSVYRSNTHMYVQVIDDVAGVTLAAASTVEPELKDLKNNVNDALKLGEAIEKKIDTCVFDRNGHLYHGIVKSIADGARKAGIKF